MRTYLPVRYHHRRYLRLLDQLMNPEPKAWKGSAFLGGLGAKALVRVKLDGENATKADQWDMGARIREVEQGPDGAIWLLEDEYRGSEGRLLKLTPKK